MNAFARSNLSVALLRLSEAQSKLEAVSNRAARIATATDVETEVFYETLGAAKWCVREAVRLVENAGAVDDMESADTLPMPPDSGARRIG